MLRPFVTVYDDRMTPVTLHHWREAISGDEDSAREIVPEHLVRCVHGVQRRGSRGTCKGDVLAQAAPRDDFTLEALRLRREGICARAIVMSNAQTLWRKQQLVHAHDREHSDGKHMEQDATREDAPQGRGW